MIYTNFKLPINDENNIHMVESLKSGPLLFIDLLHKRKALTALLIANPPTKVLVQIALMRAFKIVPCPVFVFDLILKNPHTVKEKFIAKCKGFFISMLDFIIAIHKDVSGYSNTYGIKKSKFLYVPFKANNYATRHSLMVSEGDYVVALGASQRDYRTLIEAARHTSEKIIIVCSDENAFLHNADVGKEIDYPSNIVRIKDALDFPAWYSYLAGCKFVVVPILPSAIQPAGISVYLEAMILQKAVIVSSGASTNLIINHEQEALLVQPGNPNDLAEAISRLGRDTVLRNNIAQAGFEYALSLGDDMRMRRNILDLIKCTVGMRK